MAFARILFVILGTFLMASMFDPYLPLGKPITIHAVNAILPLAFALLVLGLTGRMLVSLALSAAVIFGLCYATLMKVELLHTHIVYADLRFLAGLLQEPEIVLGFVKPTPLNLAAAFIAVASF
jgi:hypothetical protein